MSRDALSFPDIFSIIFSKKDLNNRISLILRFAVGNDVITQLHVCFNWLRSNNTNGNMENINKIKTANGVHCPIDL